MKTIEQIKQLAEEFTNGHWLLIKIKNNHLNDHYRGKDAFIHGYTQCQQDMTLQGKCLSGKSYNDCHIHSSNIFGCLSCGNFEREKL